MLYGLMQSDGKIIRKEAELYKLLITATDKDGKRFNKKTCLLYTSDAADE